MEFGVCELEYGNYVCCEDNVILDIDEWDDINLVKNFMMIVNLFVNGMLRYNCGLFLIFDMYKSNFGIFDFDFFSLCLLCFNFFMIVDF